MSNSEIPTRLHWLELALVERHGRSIVISVILLLIGCTVFWYANNKIQRLSLPQSTTR